MNKTHPLLLLFTLILSLCATTTYAQAAPIKINPTGDPASTQSLDGLVSDVLIGSTCTTLTNFKTAFGENTENKSFGYFTAEGTSFPIKKGIVLSSGGVNGIPGPGKFDGLTYKPRNFDGDPDLTDILNARLPVYNATVDATSVQFDFVSVANHISFNYIFASAEWAYSDYECPWSENQDGFAFLIQGEGITPDPEFAGKVNPWKNIALIPGTSDPVGVGTIYNNPAKCTPTSRNEQYYVSYYPPNSPQSQTAPIGHNARTTVLTAEADVIPGKTYTIKIVVADRGDLQNDSAVFLEAGSFEIGPLPPTGQDVRYCKNATAKPLEAEGSNLLWYTVAENGTGTATAPTPSTTASTDYYVSQTISGCESKRKKIQVIVDAGCVVPVTAPIKINPTGDPASTQSLDGLVSDVLIGSKCTTLTNFKTAFGENTENKSFGYFTAEGTSFPIKKGIVLSSGGVNGIPGPNKSIGLTYEPVFFKGDIDLTAILNSRFSATRSTTDATSVQFDFVSVANHISFNYIFASAEWQFGDFECPDSENQDGFAFLIQGEGITPDPEFAGKVNPWKNIALIPGTTDPVGVGTIYNNPAKCTPTSRNEQYYVSYYPYNSPQGQTSTIRHNARTTVLTAEADVIPGKTYTIKIVVADRGDSGYDSSVFLEAGSFEIGPLPPTGQDVRYCKNATAKPLEAEGSNLLWYTVAENGTGTATAPTPSTTATTDYYVSQTISGCESKRKKIQVIVDAGCATPTEICDNTIDDDGDGLIDKQDPDCPCNTATAVTAPTDLAPLTRCVLVPNTGFVQFDLTQYEKQIPQPSTGANIISYHTSEQDAQNNTNPISNPTQFQHTIDYQQNPTAPDQKIWLAIRNTLTSCTSTTTFTLTVLTTPEVGPLTPLETCDDENPATTNVFGDGIATFDLTSRLVGIKNASAETTLTYYTDKVGAENAAPQFLIATPTAYENKNPFQDTVYVRVAYKTASCYHVEPLALTVSIAPYFPTLPNYTGCSGTGSTTALVVELTDYDNLLLKGLSNPDQYEIKYYNTLIGAQQGSSTNQLNTPHVTRSSTEQIWARIQPRSGGCYVLRDFTVTVKEKLVVKLLKNTISLCETDPKNGLINLRQYESELFAFSDSSTYTISYYLTKDSTGKLSQQITSPTAYTYKNNSQKIYVKVVRYDGCSDDTVEITIQTIQIPTPKFEDAYILCSDLDPNSTLPTSQVFIDTKSPTNTYLFEWRKNGELIPGATQSGYTAKQAGEYSVQLTDKSSGCSKEFFVSVVLFSKGTTVRAQTITELFSDKSNTVRVDAFGPGQYEYQINGGAFQDDPYFYDVPTGSHLIGVQDKLGCKGLVITTTVYAMDYMRFFTPNGDGIHDTWDVLGVQSQGGADVFIYDRYGKLLKTMQTGKGGWDGTVNGQPMPSSDYWFVVAYKQNNILKEYKSHFTLKR